ncbi:MAG: aspartate aminotransferase family protein [Cognatishimia sp.]|uniref:pyridoxal phosphate-dependent decarboxylase family protein n=1 Tax=Cognatishimia sp. TaxID=2211648 RepID=UPI003B8A9E3B
MNELELLQQADQFARAYTALTEYRPSYPSEESIRDLDRLNEQLTQTGHSALSTLELMNTVAGSATVASNGPRYFGFVLGASLPVAAAADRLALAWDQCASSADSAPGVHALETQAAKWVLEILKLPEQSAVAFGTSATACGLSCIAAARAELLARIGWNYVEEGLVGAPDIRVVVSDVAHVTIKKALQILGFGWNNVIKAKTDEFGRIVPESLPDLDDQTILILQAGEVNTGEFDPFDPLIRMAHDAGAWVHVDGAFGLWARSTSRLSHLTNGIDAADSWTTDGHKWLNTPYDSAMAICRDPQALARVMNSDAVYSSASADSQKNLTLEFSRKARGVTVWAALRTLGRDGVARMVEQHHVQARFVAERLTAAGFEVLNRVVLNQVLVRGFDDVATQRIVAAVQASGRVWFGATVWKARPAFRISLSSFRTKERHILELIDILEAIGPRG